MFDKKGRVWLAAAIRGPNNPDFCKQGSSHPPAKLFPIEKNVRQLAILEPKTMKCSFVDTLLRVAPPAVRLRSRRHDLDSVADKSQAGSTASGLIKP